MSVERNKMMRMWEFLLNCTLTQDLCGIDIEGLKPCGFSDYRIFCFISWG